jgi:hypothetical protein
LQPTFESFLHVGDANDPCLPTSGSGTIDDPYVFEAYVDHFTSHTGNFAFKSCGPAAQPVLKITAGGHACLYAPFVNLYAQVCLCAGVLLHFQHAILEEVVRRTDL